MFRPRLSAVLLVAAAAVTLTGCSSTVSMTPAKGANDPACAAVTVRLPDAVDGQQRRWTDAQATGAWQSDDGRTTVLLTCGLEPPAPSMLPCQTAGGVGHRLNTQRFSVQQQAVHVEDHAAWAQWRIHLKIRE